MKVVLCWLIANSNNYMKRSFLEIKSRTCRAFPEKNSARNISTPASFPYFPSRNDFESIMPRSNALCGACEMSFKWIYQSVFSCIFATSCAKSNPSYKDTHTPHTHHTQTEIQTQTHKSTFQRIVFSLQPSVSYIASCDRAHLEVCKQSMRNKKASDKRRIQNHKHKHIMNTKYATIKKIRTDYLNMLAECRVLSPSACEPTRGIINTE